MSIATHSQSPSDTLAHRARAFVRDILCLWLLMVAGSLLVSPSTGNAQVNGVGARPYLGWTSWSQQTIDSGFLTQANITAQSDALLSSGLESHGFRYINIDSGWHGGFDSNGRPLPNLTTFPNIQALIAHIHANGQKAGIYWIPGVEKPAVVANSPILGTPYHVQDILAVPYRAGNAFGAGSSSVYHYKIDFTKPGAQAYINSIVDLFASWGVDFIKLDGVTPGSGVDNLSIDNRADVQAWSQAVAQSGRPMWLTVSWALDADYLSTWQQFANARRIEADIECEGNCSTMTDWAMLSSRFYDLVGWENDSGPALGWNDMDALDIVNNTTSGLSNEEQQAAMSLWAMANAPLFLGGDLTTLDAFGKSLLSNDEVIAVDQSGHPAQQVAGGINPVWVSDLGDETYYVAIFNLNLYPSLVSVPWSRLGIDRAWQVRDLWSHMNVGGMNYGLSAVIPGHGVRLLKVSAWRHQDSAPDDSQSYEAESATLGGTARVASCPACSEGEKVGYLGEGAENTVTFNNVEVARPGVYYMDVYSMTSGPRAFIYSVNGGPLTTLNAGGGSFLLPSRTRVTVRLHAGPNSIQFGNPTSYPPDLDRIVISGNGFAMEPASTTYEAENAVLLGTVKAAYCEYCSGVSKAGNIGGGSANTVTFPDVTVSRPGIYEMEIDYLTSGPRSYFISVNDGQATELDLSGSSFSLPTSTVIPVKLQAGVNTIQFGNATGYAPALDRIAIAPSSEFSGWTFHAPAPDKGETVRGGLLNSPTSEFGREGHEHF